MTTSKLKAFKIKSGIARSFYVANVGIIPDLVLLEQFEERDYAQRFAWFPEAITFFPLGATGTYWVELFLGDSYSVDADADFAVLLPFINSTADVVDVGGDDYGEIVQVPLAKGVYQLIYQERYLSQREIDQRPAELPPEDPQPFWEDSFGPKSCHLTLIPVSAKPEPEILKPLRGRTIESLFLHE